MITKHYNPSKLEVDIAEAFKDLTPQLEHMLDNKEVIDIKAIYDADSPMVIYKLKDNEGDLHEVVIQIIHRPDALVN